MSNAGDDSPDLSIKENRGGFWCMLGLHDWKGDGYIDACRKCGKERVLDDYIADHSFRRDCGKKSSKKRSKKRGKK